ncbi:MAG TPA: energy transducer TonB, partial [Blastocatellia bacterium]|nr:energy transducer TonB [Blastocatellia bacterium]
VLPVDSTDPVRSGLPNKLPARRDLTFTAKIVNRSAYPITHLRLAIENPSFLPNHLITIVCRLSGAAEKTANHNQPLKPNDLFTFSRKLPVEDKRDDQELLKHLSGFRLRVIGVSYSSEDDQLWLNSFLRDYDQDGMMVLRTRKDLRGISRDELLQIWRTQTPNGQPGRAALAVGRIIAENPKVSPQAQGPIGDPTGVPTPPQGGVPPVDPDPQASPQTVPYMRPDLKPTILYKEKAKYTPEARANGIQGTVVLSVIFGTDGTISGIRVVRGLPDGLTEKAIEAARKIRFHPAVKNGEAVSVRGNIEFTFEL